MDNDDTNVQEAEVVDTPPPSENGATVLLDLESLIKTHITTIDKGKEELKKFREMLTSALANDATYKLHEEEAKKAAKQKSATRQQILKTPENANLVKKIQELANDIKEKDEALSDYLREYQRMSGSNEIETDDGEVREIVYVAKLVKKSSKFGR